MWRPPNAKRHPLPSAVWPTKQEAQESLLFSPLKVGRLELQERTWIPAMVPWRASADGEVTDRLLKWYERFAMGQPGAIVVEATGIRDIPSGPLLRIGHDRYVDGLRTLVDTVKRASDHKTKVFIQLIDFLRVNRRPTQERYCSRYLEITDSLVSAVRLQFPNRFSNGVDEIELRQFLAKLDDGILSTLLSDRQRRDLDYGYRDSVNDTHLAHISELPKQLPTLFADAAERAQDAGFDGVELHFAHAYTMASFLSKTNQRTDGYGSDLEGRLKCPLEVFHSSRNRVADEFVIGCRMLIDEVIENGNHVSDAIAIAQRFAEEGFDFISLSTGGKFDDAKQPKVGASVYPYTGPSGFECMPTVYADERGPFGRNLQKMKRLTQSLRGNQHQTPVIIAGGIQTFEMAEDALKGGDGDIIASARQSLADPDWFMKCKVGRGEEIRRCAMTNYCEALDTQHKEVTCRLWDRHQLDDPLIQLSSDGKRRLTAPDMSE